MRKMAKLPENFKDLSEHAPLMYNMVENEKFQPVHFDFRGKVPFVILGRFQGEVQNNGCFRLSNIELAVYTWDTTKFHPPLFLVNDAVLDSAKTKDQRIHINLELKKLEDMNPANRKRRLQKKLPECELDLVIDVHPDDRIFFEIVNYGDFLKLHELPEDRKYVSGRNCNGLPVFPPPGGRD